MKKTIYDFLLMSDNDMFKHLNKVVDKNFQEVATDGENYIWGTNKGSKTCLVAHIDTVCSGGFKDLQTKDGIITNLNGILGADDRAGCFGVQYIIQKMKDLPFDVLFTNYEESGGLGVTEFLKDFEAEFDDSDYTMLIELDRCGVDEYVTYCELPAEVKLWLAQFKLTKKYGSFSDISCLTDATKLPSINVGIGYYSQHTSFESLNLKHLLKQLKVIIQMIENPLDLRYDASPEDYGWNSYDIASKNAIWKCDQETGRWYDSSKGEAPKGDGFCRSCGAVLIEDDYCYECHTWEADVINYDDMLDEEVIYCEGDWTGSKIKSA